MSQIFCPKCKKTMDEGQFYTYKNGTKTEQCKKCMTMHIDNYNPETFLWLLEKMDVPYIEQEWNTLRDRAAAKSAQDRKPMTGMSVFGKYLSKMKLKQWHNYSWEDTERLKAENAMKTQAAIDAGTIDSNEHLKELFDAGEISESEYKTLSTEDTAKPPRYDDYPINSPYTMVDLPDPAADLTEEDMKYLAMKWGRLYRPEQWIALEKMWTEMHNSFDIQGAVREDQVIKICKTSLKMDEALDCGDVDTYQKLTRMYDILNKAGKFNESQKKDDGKGFIDSIGELVAICETEEGYIPRYIIDVPQDKVDITIQDMNRYTYNLVTKELGLGQLIEDAVKKIQIQKEMEEDEEANLGDLDAIEEAVLSDEDLMEFYETVEAQKRIDFEEADEDVPTGIDGA